MRGAGAGAWPGTSSPADGRAAARARLGESGAVRAEGAGPPAGRHLRRRRNADRRGAAQAAAPRRGNHGSTATRGLLVVRAAGERAVPRSGGAGGNRARGRRDRAARRVRLRGERLGGDGRLNAVPRQALRRASVRDRGSVTVKVLPRPGTLTTRTSPPS